MAAHKIFLDTNNWIYLANGFNVLSKEHDDLHLKIFDIIEKRVDDGFLTFLVNDIILEEFDRNKIRTEDKIKKIQDKANSYDNTLKAMKVFSPEQADQIEDLRKNISNAARDKIDIQRKHIERVGFFLKNKTKKIDITAENKIKAAEMALEKKAPFVGDKKNSMADAIIMLSSISHIENNEKISFQLDENNQDEGYYRQSYFVSSNTGDFSDPNQKENIHPDLAPLLSKCNIKFYHNLNPLITTLDEEFLTAEEESWIESADDYFMCPNCEYEHAGLDFSKINILDPHRLNKDSNDPGQLDIFTGKLINVDDPYVKTITAFCDNCSSDFIQCPNCDELVNIPVAEDVTECSGCNYQFILHVETDHNGQLLHEEYEIVNYPHCTGCGSPSETLNDGLCDTCDKYRIFEEQQ